MELVVVLVLLLSKVLWLPLLLRYVVGGGRPRGVMDVLCGGVFVFVVLVDLAVRRRGRSS